MQQFPRFARSLISGLPLKWWFSGLFAQKSRVSGVKADYFILVKKHA
jgi:hypothetical protein